MLRRRVLMTVWVILALSFGSIGVSPAGHEPPHRQGTAGPDVAAEGISEPAGAAVVPRHDVAGSDHVQDQAAEHVLAAPEVPVPPDRPARGLVYRGLQPAAPGGPCDVGDGTGGVYEIRHDGRFLGCTHGPDPAPVGMDVRESEPSAGTEAVSGGSVPCVGDGVSGYRTQAIYAHRATAPSRFKTYAPLIRGWAADVVDTVFDDSAAKTGGSRHVRFVTDPASCKLDIDVVAMPDTAVSSMGGTVSFLKSNGYVAADRKYLVWMDANVYCGIAELYGDDRDIVGNYNNGPSFVPGMISRVDAGCWGRTSSTSTPVEAHELMHNLGGVQDSAPNSTYSVPGTGGHCTDEYDVMCYDDDGAGPVTMSLVCSPQSSHERLFDCGDDDYFHTSPATGSYLETHWNTADSRFLITDDPSPPSTAPPANDDFASAEPLSGSSPTTSGTNVAATTESGEPTHAGNAGGASVWFRWTAPGDGTAAVSTSGSAIDSVVGVYTGGSVDGLSPVAANDDRSANDLTSRATFGTVAGTEYRIAVDGYGGDVGSLSLQVAYGAPEARGSIGLGVNKKRVQAGRKVRLAATVPGCDPGDPVRFRGRGFSATKALGEGCQATVRAAVWRTTRFRAIDLATGERTPRVKVRLKR